MERLAGIDLERRPAAHEEQHVIEGKPIDQELSANHLVHGVVPAHILAQHEEFAVRSEEIAPATGAARCASPRSGRRVPADRQSWRSNQPRRSE